MEYDLHLIRTEKKLKEIKKVIKTEVFGNYDVKDIRPVEPKAEFGVFLFRFDEQHVIVKLDYTFINYATVSRTLMEALGAELKEEYWVIGLELEREHAFIRYYKYEGSAKTMQIVEYVSGKDGLDLTPQAKSKWNIDSHTAWKTMKEKMDWENMRQTLLSGKNIHTPFGNSKEAWENQWKEKFGEKASVKKRICDTMFFVARENIEQYRPDVKDMTIEMVKMGKVVMEDDGKGGRTRTVVPKKDGEETMQ